MKKILSALMTPLLLTSTTLSVISCGQKKELSIALVPSKNSSSMNKLKPQFCKLITDKLKQIDPSFNLKVNVKSSSDYAAAAKGLASGNEAVAFLQAKLYCQSRGSRQENGTYNKAAVLLTPTRQEISAEKEKDNTNIQSDWTKPITAEESLKIVKNYSQIDKTIKDKNDIESKLFCNTDVKYYRACIYANKDFLLSNQFDFENVKTEKEYVDKIKVIIKLANKQKKLQLGKVNSSASFIYPLKWMSEILNFSSSELTEIIKSQSHSNIPSCQNIEKLIKGDEILITAGYGDIRTEIKDSEKLKQAYENIQVIGACDAVANDAIQYSRKWFKNEQKLLKNLRKVFCELVADPNNYAIFNEMYSHKNYHSPSENASEKEIAEWEANIDQIYTEIENKFSSINKLIEDAKTK